MTTARTPPPHTRTHTHTHTAAATTAAVKFRQDFPKLDKILSAKIVELPKSLDKEATAAAVLEHLNKLQQIAIANGPSVAQTVGEGNRDIGYAGFNASRDYIWSTLQENTDFELSMQFFEYDLGGGTNGRTRVVGTPAFVFDGAGRAFVYRADFRQMSSGGFNGAIESSSGIFAATGLGCTAADYSGMRRGQIAVLQRGDCGFYDKALLAQQMGAMGCVIYNSAADPGVLNGQLGDFGSTITIPVFGFSNAAGLALVAAAADAAGVATVQMSMVLDDRVVVASNICAQSREGLPDRTIVVGSHMDGVAAGPGNNDNGSGAMTNLELALSLARLMARGAITLTNRVRFCWWGAEEEGLVGSHWYVDHLSDAEIDEIAVNLNYDMVGSPNYVIGVYNGSSLLDGGGAEELRTGGYGQALGSAALQTMYQSYIETVVGSPHVPVEFNGRSDYGPFLERGIACSGLETGAEKIKTAAERAMFGGIANAAYDPCYHQFCDSIDNVSPEALAVNVPTAAYAVEFLGTHPQLNTFLHRDEQPPAVSLDKEVSAETVMAHLQHLQDLADENGGNRDIAANGGAGFTATRDFLVQMLRDNTDYDVEIQDFPYRSEVLAEDPVMMLTSPETTAYTYSRRTPQFRSMTYSGTGDVTAAIWGPPAGLATQHPQHHGCLPADFEGMPTGSIVMVERGKHEQEKPPTSTCAHAGAIEMWLIVCAAAPRHRVQVTRRACMSLV
eukprot:SAG22_NODE_343_length_11944_cov_15.500042_3_plen_728_part_00